MTWDTCCLILAKDSLRDLARAISSDDGGGGMVLMGIRVGRRVDLARCRREMQPTFLKGHQCTPSRYELQGFQAENQRLGRTKPG